MQLDFNLKQEFLKKVKMKKVVLLFAVALVFAACGPKTNTETQEETPAVEVPTTDSIVETVVDSVTVVVVDSIA